MAIAVETAFVFQFTPSRDRLLTIDAFDPGLRRCHPYGAVVTVVGKKTWDSRLQTWDVRPSMSTDCRSRSCFAPSQWFLVKRFFYFWQRLWKRSIAPVLQPGDLKQPHDSRALAQIFSFQSTASPLRSKQHLYFNLHRLATAFSPSMHSIPGYEDATPTGLLLLLLEKRH